MNELPNEPNHSLYFSDKTIEQLVEKILGPNQLQDDASAFALMTIIERLAYDQDFTVCDNNAVRLTQAIFRRTQAFETAAFAFADRAGAAVGTGNHYKGSALSSLSTVTREPIPFA